MQASVKQIYGKWQAVNGILAGNAMSQEIVSATTLSIDEHKYSVNLAGVLDSGTCVIDSNTNTFNMTIEGNNGPNAGKTYFAILEFLSNDQIRIAYDLSGGGFPSSFSPKPDESNYVATFTRIQS